MKEINEVRKGVIAHPKKCNQIEHEEETSTELNEV